MSPELPMPGNPDGKLVIERRRAMRLLAAAVGWCLIGIGPILLVLIFVIDGMHLDGLGLIRMSCALALSAVGAWLISANRPDWLVVVLDDHGMVLRRGKREFGCPWAEMRAIEATSRRSGRTSIPTVCVTCEGGREIFLDDVFTVRQRELSALLKARVTESGNAFAAQPVRREKLRVAKRAKWAWLVLIALLLSLSAAAMLQVWLNRGH